jgi:hypothetical protein
MKNLMHYLNGAALGGIWILLEHINKLEYTHLITLNKEIQMVQQQFIIAELSQDGSQSEERKNDTQSQINHQDVSELSRQLDSDLIRDPTISGTSEIPSPLIEAKNPPSQSNFSQSKDSSVLRYLNKNATKKHRETRENNIIAIEDKGDSGISKTMSKNSHGAFDVPHKDDESEKPEAF